MLTKSELNIVFEVVQKENDNVQLSNLLGNVLFTSDKINFIGFYINKINRSLRDNGVYIFNLRVGSKVHPYKIFLI